MIEEEAKNCKSCLDWHKHCKAECCKSISFTYRGSGKNIKRGMFFVTKLEGEMTEDLKKYYNLHDVRVKNNRVMVRIKDFEIRDGLLIVYKRCKLLNDDLTCKGHPDDKPDVCKELDETTVNDKRFLVTSNCMFRYKTGGEL